MHRRSYRISAAPSNGPPSGRRVPSEDTHVIHQHDDHVGSLRPRCGAQHKSDQESGDVHLLGPSKSRDISVGYAGVTAERPACFHERAATGHDQAGYFTSKTGSLDLYTCMCVHIYGCHSSACEMNAGSLYTARVGMT